MPNNLVSRRNMRTSIPALLGTRHDSREMIPRSYYDAFPKPDLSPLKWHYDSSLDLGEVEKIARELIPGEYGSNTPVLELVKKINRYMNSIRGYDKSPRYKDFARKFRKTRGVIYPAWFNADADTLYLRFTNKGHSNWLRGGLWNLRTPASAGRVKHLALEPAHMFPQGHGVVGTPQRAWYDMSAWSNMNEYDLQSLSLVLLLDREVMTITIDDKGVLKDSQ